eukprot:6183260-Pleurochrysis_carterae.AAC.1
MLNVAALSAAIAIGAMQFIDAGATAKPTFAPLLCLAARRAAQLIRVTHVAPTLRHDRRSQANRARCEPVSRRAGATHRMLIVIALLATRTAASPRVRPETRQEQRASLDSITARASLCPGRSDLRLPGHLSTFSLAAHDAEHVCCLYIANGRVILACWLLLQSHVLWILHWTLLLLLGTCGPDLYQTHRIGYST